MKTSLLKLMLLLVIATVLVGCDEDDPGVITVTETSGFEAEEQCLSPVSGFQGVSSVTNISQREAVVSWQKVDDAATYSIFLIKDGISSYKGTQRGNKSTFKLKGLIANTSYKVFVRMMDKEGKVDTNQVLFDFSTIPWPTYENSHSISLDGGQVVELPNSDEIITNKKFSISVWFKTNQTQGDARIVNLKRQGNGTSMNISVDSNSVNLGYRDGDGNFKKLEYNVAYDDNEWHNVVATYNNKKYQLYYDGSKVLELVDTFAGHGAEPAIIGGYQPGGNTFIGSIDEVSLWKTVLGNSKVQEVYNNGESFDLNQHSKYGSLRAWYRFSENANDEKGNFDGSENGFLGDTYDNDTI